MTDTSIANTLATFSASGALIALPNNIPLRFVINAPAFPTDQGTDQKCTFAILSGNTVLYLNDSGKCTVGVQGQTSAGASKKNLKIKVKNANGDKVKIKFGDWLENSSITLKAYGSIPGNATYFDRTMIREAASLELWRQIRRNSPRDGGRIGPWTAWDAGDTAKECANFISARFSCDCRASEVYFTTDASQAPSFSGVYILRSDNDLPEYLMDDANPAHYLLQPQHGPWDVWQNFNSANWEYTSPKTPDDAVPRRLMTYFANVLSGADTWANYYQYISLHSFMDYLIFCDVVGSFDSITNNVMLVSWDASADQGIFHLCTYDTDEVLGSKWGYQGNAGSFPEDTGRACDQNAVFASFAAYFRKEIAARYCSLRNTGVLSNTNFLQILTSYAGWISPANIDADKATFGTNPISNYPFLIDWFDRRLAALDSSPAYSIT